MAGVDGSQSSILNKAPVEGSSDEGPAENLEQHPALLEPPW